MWALTAAWTAFTSLSGIGMVLAVVGALGVLVAVCTDLINIDIGGWIGAILSPFRTLGDIINEVVWYLKAAYAVLAYLGELGIQATLDAIGGAFAWVGQRIQDFTTWLTDLPIVGDAIAGIFGVINSVLGLFDARAGASTESAGFLSTAISNVGLAIGSVLRLILALVGPVIDAWDWFTESVNNTIGAIATLIEGKLAALKRILAAAYSWVAPLVSAVSGVLIPVLESLGWVVDLVVGNLDLIAVGLGVLFGPLSLAAGLVYLLITRFGQITDAVGGFVGYIVNDLPIISNIVQFVADTFGEFFTNLGRVFGALWSIIASVVDILANLWAIPKLLKVLGVVTLLSTAFTVLKAAVMAVVGVFEWLYDVLEPILAPLIAVASAVLDVLMPAFEALWNIAKALAPVIVAIGAAVALVGSGPIGLAVGAFAALVAVVKVLAVALGWWPTYWRP